MFRNCLVIPLFIYSCCICAQKDTLPANQDNINQDLIEDLVQEDSSEDFDFNTIFENLEYLRDHPININKAKREDLEELKLLSEIQITDLINYRKEYGELIALEELQAIPSFDLNTIKWILPYISTGSDIDDFQVPITKMLYEGKNELYLRWGRTLETKRGYTEREAGDTTSQRYLGDPNKLYFRYKHTYENNRLTFGITGEKDPGEQFFRGSNKNGFDYYSAHFSLKDYNKTLKNLVIGDFSVSFGQGLLLYSGFGTRKSSAVSNIRRSRRTILPYTSVNESNYMRGIGATFNINENIEVSVLGSLRKRDGNLSVNEIATVIDDGAEITSLLEDGFHRTPNEIADKNAISLINLGGNIKYKKDNWHIAANVLYNKLNVPLIRNSRPYNQFFFNGDRLFNASLDYAYIFQNFNFFGETAMSDNGAVATVNGLLVGLDRKIDLAFLYRNYPKDYHTLTANAFGETSGVRNEEGFYIGAIFKPTRQWILSAYFDSYQHPWLRFGADAPSKGFDYRARITYFRKRKMNVYLEIRDEFKEINARNNETNLDFLVKSRLFQVKLHVGNRITKYLELRNRIHFGFFDDGNGTKQDGFLILQDVIYKPMLFPLHITARFAVFNTDSYNIRFYNYENDLLYSFSIPAYYNKGTRFYINLRYKGIRNMTIEARFAQTYWSNRDFIGSALERIEGQQRSEVKAQIKYTF